MGRDYTFAPVDGRHWEVLRVTNQKWNRVIIEALIEHGELRYTELKRELDGISDKVLSESLQDLETLGLVKRTVRETRPVEVAYSPTRAGAGLEKVMESVNEWLEEHASDLGQLDAGSESA